MGPTNDKNPLVQAYHKVLVWDMVKAPFVTRFTEKVLNPLIGKSVVVYATPAPGNGERRTDQEVAHVAA